VKKREEKRSEESEEKNHKEKRQLEKIIHDKDLTICDQQATIAEKEDEIKKMGNFFVVF